MICSRASFSHFSLRKQRADVPVLVFLHGLLGNGGDWQSVLIGIGLRLICPDTAIAKNKLVTILPTAASKSPLPFFLMFHRKLQSGWWAIRWVAVSP